MPSYLVTGSEGQLGLCFRSIQHEFPQYKLLFSSHSEVDINQIETLLNYFEKFPFEGIINCAAYTNVDLAEKNVEIANKINIDGVRTLIKFAELKNLKIIHFSTDFVFDGLKRQDYIEEDVPNPLNIYGQSKWIGEAYLEKANFPSVSFRVSWLISPFGQNFVKTIIKACRSNSVLNVVNDQFGKPTYGIDLARVVLISLGNSNLFQYKTYHFAQGPETSWYDIAQSIIELTGLNCVLQPIKSSAYFKIAKRPMNSSLSTQRIEKTLSLNIRNWHSALEDCLKKIQDS